ncbi:hypothetical protein [Paracoccus indicus]|uniref:hypothetical protein n=1 Tax=Paracoccus indicus TaxID=2079229 RepID=UPI001B8B686A|nr:hypothetical protein [Paracoccus indicus]
MDANTIISEIEQYSAASGLKASTVCQRAFGNARYLNRLNSRLERLNEELERFRLFAANNPPNADGVRTQPDHQPFNQEPSHDTSPAKTAPDAA